MGHEGDRESITRGLREVRERLLRARGLIDPMLDPQNSQAWREIDDALVELEKLGFFPSPTTPPTDPNEAAPEAVRRLTES